MAENKSGLSGNVVYIYSKEIHEAGEVFKVSVKRYDDIRHQIDQTTSRLFDVWQGRGKQQFETDYRLLFQQLKDIGDTLYDLRNYLIEAEAYYIKADEEQKKRNSVFA